MKLVRYDAMCRAIDAAHQVDAIPNIAAALERLKQATHCFWFPSSPGVYVFEGMDGYLYVGESKNIRKHLHHHSRGYLRRSVGVRCLVIPCRNHKEVERWLIRALKPSLNGTSEAMLLARSRPAARKSFDDVCAEFDRFAQGWVRGAATP
jgi:hypothetical protein